MVKERSRSRANSNSKSSTGVRGRGGRESRKPRSKSRPKTERSKSATGRKRSKSKGKKTKPTPKIGAKAKKRARRMSASGTPAALPKGGLKRIKPPKQSKSEIEKMQVCAIKEMRMISKREEFIRKSIGGSVGAAAFILFHMNMIGYGLFTLTAAAGAVVCSMGVRSQ